ncbi:transketolase [Crenobacter cavernae]|uniref:Transketolase n=1 Tax=Crenobacter cavernae TaxID=2290923 RepID=A0A345Y527_9NEIS|nr:transketolase [Crenobacter cavernae]AXK39029.1 transketolase [Crenobacter cavernae]
MADALAFARAVRRTALQMVHNAKASHIGSALSIADILAVLYHQHLNCNPDIPNAKNRDRFILSKGHACVAVYAALAEKGFISKAAVESYGQDFSDLMNHISHKVTGVEFSTGSLGHGLPFGVGKALAAKKLQEEWRTFVLLGDGEMDEGSNWEALMFAAHHKLDNLVAIIDYNNLQSLTTVDNTLCLEPLADKLRAFGCSVVELDGHDHDALNLAFSKLPAETGKPTAIIARTIKGKGVSFMENSVDWHYKSPNKEQLEQALRELEMAHA